MLLSCVWNSVYEKSWTRPVCVAEHHKPTFFCSNQHSWNAIKKKIISKPGWSLMTILMWCMCKNRLPVLHLSHETNFLLQGFLISNPFSPVPKQCSGTTECHFLSTPKQRLGRQTGLFNPVLWVKTQLKPWVKGGCYDLLLSLSDCIVFTVQFEQGLSPCTAKYPPPPSRCVPTDNATVSICPICCTWFGSYE